MNPILSYGIQFIQLLQNLSPALDFPMHALSFLGTVQFYLVFIPFIYWLIDVKLGMRLLLILLTNDVMGSGFKQIFHQPRPYYFGNVKMLATDPSYGIPSTHASSTSSVWGFMAYRVNKRWLWIVSIAIILLVGLSRMYLAVHFPTDVLGGWLLGLVSILLFVLLEKPVVAWAKKRSTLTIIGLAFVAAMFINALGWIILSAIAPYPDPPVWASFSAGARSFTDYATLSAALFGAITGFVLMQRTCRFDTRGTIAQKALRFLIGAAVILGLYFGLDKLFSILAADETILGYILRFIRYAVLAFWAAFGAPWVFIKLRLAQKG